MNVKEKFLKLKNYKEFNDRREEFRNLEMDKDVLEHMRKIFPRVSSTKEELYKKPPEKGGTIGR